MIIALNPTWVVRVRADVRVLSARLEGGPLANYPRHSMLMAGLDLVAEDP